MTRLFILFLLITTIIACKQEERELANELLDLTQSKNVGIYYTTHTIPKTPEKTIDIELTECTLVENENAAKNIAARTSIYVLHKLPQDKLDENQEIRITFLSPNFPNTLFNNFYSFKLNDLRKATHYINLSQNIIESYYSKLTFLLEREISKEDIVKVDSLLKITLSRKDSLMNISFGTFQTFVNDSSKQVNTAISNLITTNNSQKFVTFIFDNKTNKVIEINSD